MLLTFKKIISMKVCNLRVDFSDSSIRLAEVSKKIIQRVMKKSFFYTEPS